jgi:hypothetical protein
MSFYQFTLHLHSILRYVALFLILWTIVNSIISLIKKHDFAKSDRFLALLTLIAIHTQIVIGLVLYILSPKVLFMKGVYGNALIRFFTMEHISIMLVAAIVLTIGYSKAKKQVDIRGHKKIFVYYLIATILIFAAIPWPFMVNLGGSWY